MHNKRATRTICVEKFGLAWSPVFSSNFDPARDYFVFQNIAKIYTNVAKTNFCNIFVAKKCCMKFRVFLTCCKAQCCKLFGEKINVAKAYVANILANQQCCKHKIAKNVAKKKPMVLGALNWLKNVFFRGD